ncbi:hypothetical protein ABT301_24045 [Streptomyces sp. NPDC000987]|uniref:hypothetical protein n=1 Tax=Streptomyces sp. NPDC000987 TaxID=3154374 RepID=UPI00331FD008
MSWRPPVPMGYLESIQAVGGMAAPLLAGGSFTLAVLALQSSVPGPVAVSRWPDASLALFVAAGLLQIATVQATAWTWRYVCTPGDLLQWFPGEQTDGVPTPFLLGMQRSHLLQAHRWANAARGFYHAGIVALLTGLLVACVPRGPLTGARWTVLAVCAAGVAGEFGWLFRALFLDRGIRRRAAADAAVLLAIAVAATAPGIWDGAPALVVGAVCLSACLLPLVLRQQVTSASVVSGVSLAAGGIALFLPVPQPLVTVVLAPAFWLAVRAFAAVIRRQRAWARDRTSVGTT